MTFKSCSRAIQSQLHRLSKFSSGSHVLPVCLSTHISLAAHHSMQGSSAS